MHLLRLLSQRYKLRVSALSNLRSPTSNVGVVRFNSTLTSSTEEVLPEVDIEESVRAAKPYKKPLPLWSYINYIFSDSAGVTNPEEILNRVQTSFTREADSPFFDEIKSTKLNRSSIHKIMTKLSELQPEEPEAATNYRVLSIMKETRMADVSHFNRVMESYLRENEPDEALSVFVESIEYQKSLSDASAYFATRFPNDIYRTLYLSYLSSCFAKGQEPHLEVFKQISSKTIHDVPEKEFSYSLNKYNFSDEFKLFARQQFEKHRVTSADPNDARLISSGLQAALNRQLSLLERCHNRIINISEISGIPINEETYRNLMHMYSTALKPQKAQDIWNKMIDSLGKQPSLESWNELLYSFTKVKTVTSDSDKKENLLKLEITYKYVDENFKIDETTITHLITGYLANAEFEKPFQLIQELSTTGIKGVKLTDSITTSYLMGLFQAGLKEEALDLLDSFIAKGYKPKIRLVNTLLAHFIKKKDFQKCDELVKMINKFDLAPDIATYTFLIDIILRNSQNATSLKLDQLLGEVISEMGKNGFTFANSVTLSAIISGLAKEGSLDSVKVMVGYMSERRITIPFKLCTSLVDAAGKFGDLDYAKQVFVDSVKRGVRPNVPYYNAIINACLRCDSLKDALHFYNVLLKDAALKPNFYTYYQLLSYFSRARRLDVDTANKIVADVAYQVENNAMSLGQGLPKTLLVLKEKGIHIPSVLERRPSHQ